VAITARTRKVLWALSNNQCARCEATLIRAPEADGDVHAIVGQECHIVARSLAGPRGEAEPRGDVDGIDNLILLCANCHAVVDGQPETWTPEALRALKREHEEKVSRAAAKPSSPFSFEIRGREKPITINRLTTGDEVLALLGRGYSRMHTTPPDMSSIQREKVGAFLQNAFDWSEIVGEMGPQGELEAGGQLQEELDDLSVEGILVYGAVRGLGCRATGEEADTPWPEAVIRVVHEHEAREPAAEAA
jgi:5-methylcytosine-specific restriction endonuclease McrA